jgi:hypothetical protein
MAANLYAFSGKKLMHADDYPGKVILRIAFTAEYTFPGTSFLDRAATILVVVKKYVLAEKSSCRVILEVNNC